ncbi:Calcium-transporting ATPase 2 [Neolecta irregularis DAH-3]|uniref:Calcium-transporting ATPase n=1 Tax=Neolecta irregularis (strain DAH-3) TaxID=1198029 RepID=A0A1U7LT83_NEOID|nr:Calcium-transporting ATPase 2 [Neolecta irregularis DAH-3]|eukprot:OLL25886.1 Calcium-transporting ATPase 2 [Neolecta irregularis DAH-3]
MATGSPTGRRRAPTINIDNTNLNFGESPSDGQDIRTDENPYLSVPVKRHLSSSRSRTSSEGLHSLDGSTIHGGTYEAPNLETDDTNPSSPFAFTPKQLTKLTDPKSTEVLRIMGGVEGLCLGLRTDRKAGLSIDELYLDGKVTLKQLSDPEFLKRHVTTIGQTEPRIGLQGRSSTIRTAGGTQQTYPDRLRYLGINVLPEKPIKSLFVLMWIALQDKVMILLSIAAIVSLSLGLYQTFGQPAKRDLNGNMEPKVDWVEGIAIIVAITIVVMVGALNDYQKERQFKEDRHVNVIRSGSTRQISVYDLLVGDLVHLEPGDIIPVDGVLVSGHNIKCDESATTGESDSLKKLPADECLATPRNAEGFSRKYDCLIISGSKVEDGTGTFIVTNVGQNSFFGKTMMGTTEPEDTPLQVKLNRVAESIAKMGGSAALLLFVVLFIRFLTTLPNSTQTNSEKGQNFLQILIVSITVVVVAVPEGLPLAVTLALAFATTRMLKDNNLVRVLRACETMGNATTICSDKTGTLTQNKMCIVRGVIGIASKFRVPPQDVSEEKKSFEHDDQVLISDFMKRLSPAVQEILLSSISLNSTAFEGMDKGEKAFIGSKTETALLEMARIYLGMGNPEIDRGNAQFVQYIPFTSERKSMEIVVKLSSRKYRLFVKGASEILLAMCSNIIAEPLGDEIITRPLTERDIESLILTIDNYANQSLRTIGLCWKDFDSWPPRGYRLSPDDRSQVLPADLLKDLNFLSIVGIMDPLRPGVGKAVADCVRAGVFVRMVTGDNVVTAKAIATECGILTQGGMVLEGPKFRAMSDYEKIRILPRLQVLARSSPEDKRILVKLLKDQNETVAVTGDGTNDGPALKTADVGFSMGIAGTEVAKEASSIILMDDNFSSIVKAILWGRCVNDSVKKFLQFQLTVNITAVLLTFVSAVASSDESSVLTAVQLLWVNLIMDTFAALALATDPPTEKLLDRKPDSKTAGLISFTMWKMIIGQAIYQLVVTFILNFEGNDILGYNSASEQDGLRTVVFNTFVWCQIFNEFNNRRLDNGLNIFEGIHRNFFFIVITFLMIAGQFLIIFVGGSAFQVHQLDGIQWIISIVLGALSIPVGIVLRLIPDKFIAKFIPDKIMRPTPPYQEQLPHWNHAIDNVRDELLFMKAIRSRGRYGGLGIRKNIRRLMPGSPKPSMSKEDTAPHTPSMPPSPMLSSPGSSHRRGRSRSNSILSAAVAAPMLMASSIGAGWTPDPLNNQPLDSPQSILPSSSMPPSPSSLTAISGVSNGNTQTDHPSLRDRLTVGHYHSRKNSHGSIPEDRAGTMGRDERRK